MIKINLATRKGARASTDKDGKIDFAKGLDVGKLLELLKVLPIRQVVLVVVVGAFANYALTNYKVEELAKVEKKLTEVSAKKAKADAEFAKTKDYAGLKKALDSDELSLKTKMGAIQKLLDDRTTPPKLLTTLSKAIPAEIWLSEFSIRDDNVSFRGASLSFNTISDFMKSLEDSIYFKSLTLLSTQLNKDATGVDVANFELTARRR